MTAQHPPIELPPRPPGPPVGPVTVTDRIESIDVLRGFALLGILVMNIPWFAWSDSAFFNPTKAGGFDGADYLVWLVSHMFFDMKMMTIFSMLFGAGMLVMTHRAAAAGASPGFIYYRRLGWLLLFGLLHAYLLWSGDILYSYALCGLVLYPIRRLPAGWLIAIGVVVLGIGLAIMIAQGWFFSAARDAAERAEQTLAAGGTPTEFDQSMSQAWSGMAHDFEPDADARAAERAAHLGSYWELFQFRAFEAVFMQTFLFADMLLWRALGPMLLGMGLMKLGVIGSRRSTSFYLAMMALGYGVGLPLVYVGVRRMEAHQFDFVWSFKMDWAFNYVGSVIIALAHIGAITLVHRFGIVRPLVNALAAVGRMALTNYLSHSLILSVVFFGWGFGQWGSLSRTQTAIVVFAIWAFQLIASPMWLSRFRFGPMEWLWRSLTYWRLQPMRRLPTEVVPV